MILIIRDSQSLEPFAKRLLAQPPRYAKKFYPRNIKYMPAVNFLACLDFERK